MSTLWSKGTQATELVDDFTVGNDRVLDLRLAKYDVLGSKAHIKMLESIGLLSAEELEILTEGLDVILKEIEAGDWDDSFVSGHTTMSFAAAAFTTFMFCQYFPDSPWKIPVITASFTAAAVTGGLRIASGNHFVTDVLAGAGLGSVIGFLVPWINSFWLKPSLSRNYTGTISPLGFSFCINF